MRKFKKMKFFWLIQRMWILNIIKWVSLGMLGRSLRFDLLRSSSRRKRNVLTVSKIFRSTRTCGVRQWRSQLSRWSWRWWVAAPWLAEGWLRPRGRDAELVEPPRGPRTVRCWIYKRDVAGWQFTPALRPSKLNQVPGETDKSRKPPLNYHRG